MKTYRFRQDITFSEVWEKAQIKLERKGVLSRKLVIALQVLFAKEAGVCDNPECNSTENLTADHIVPVFLLKMFGYPAHLMFRIEWYQVLCYSCNSRKSHRMDWDSYRTYAILRQVIKEKPTWEYERMQKEYAKHHSMMSECEVLV